MQREVAQTVSAVAESPAGYEQTPIPQSQATPETTPKPQQQRPITQTDINAAWEECKQQFTSDMQLQVIASAVSITLLSASELQCVLQAQTQKTTFEQKIQPVIIRFFREKLGVTFSLQISVPEVVVEKKIYGDHASFEYLAQKNPAVESLKEKLGLEYHI